MRTRLPMDCFENAYPWSHYPFEVRTAREGDLLVVQPPSDDAGSGVEPDQLVIPAASSRSFIEAMEAMANATDLGELIEPRVIDEIELAILPLPDGRLVFEQGWPDVGGSQVVILAASQVGGLVDSVRRGSGKQFGLMVAPVGAQDAVRIIQSDGDEEVSVLLGKSQVYDLLELLCEVAGVEKPWEKYGKD